MQKNKRFIIACCLLWGSLLALACLGDSDSGFLLFIFVFPISVISWLVLSGVAVYRVSIQNYLPWEKRLIPLYFSVDPMIVWFTIGTVANAIKEDSTWLVITNADFRGSNNFRFTKDGEYSSWRDSPLGRSAEEDGRYERQDSILILHPEQEKDKEFKLVIRPYSEFERQQFSPHITLVSLDTTVRDY